MPQSIRCPYCRSNHVDTFPCKQAKAAGITKADLPDAYYIDTNTGECPPPKRTESTTVQESGESSGPVEKQPTAVENDSMRESERKTLQQWRERNRERYNETMRQWREDNREKVRAYQREYMRQRRKARQSES